MRDFVTDCKEYFGDGPRVAIRAAEARGEDMIEVCELWEANRCQNVYSVAKAFTMTAIGLLWDRGEVTLDERVTDILRDGIPGEGVDPRWETVTVEMLLRHRAGLPDGFLDIDTTPIARFGRDFLAHTMTRPLSYPPGEEERYSDGAYYLLSLIAEKKSGMRTDAFMWKEMLWKMGYQEFGWSCCPLGHAMGATGLYISAEDMVKLGFLYANGGVWRGERLLSREWIDLAFGRELCVMRDETGKMYVKGGMYGQSLAILPGERRAAALQAYGADSRAFEKWYRDRVLAK